MARKDRVEVAKYVHPDVHFLGPVECHGKDAFLGATQRRMALSTGLEIRAVVGEKERARVACDLIFPAPAGTVRTAALLFFDAVHPGRLAISRNTRPTGDDEQG